jgi:multiple sugar transport system permease protein
VLTSEVWWQSVLNTLVITLGSVSLELVLGMALALVMHRVLFLRRTVRASVLVPYGIITVVAALAWKFAFDPVTGFVNPLLGVDRAWLTERWSAFLVIILTEVWKTTPFMALLLLAGLTLVPDDLLKAARVDGASPLQRFFRVTLPLMRPAILVALLFRTLDAFRIFDTVYVQTRGAQGTETVSVVGYHALITRLNLGLGSAVSVLIFLCVIAIAVLFVKGFGTRLARREEGA